MHRNFLIIYLVATVAFPARAEPPIAERPRLEGSAAVARKDVANRAQEFYSTSYAGELLIPVKLIGAVKTAGIYHIPKKTDLATLLAMAGGTTSEASNSVLIKRRALAKETVTVVDLKYAIETPDAPLPFLESDDIIVVQSKEPLVSQDTLTMMGLVASVLSLILSSIIISQATRK